MVQASVAALSQPQMQGFVRWVLLACLQQGASSASGTVPQACTMAHLLCSA